MRWYKHKTNAHSDDKMVELLRRFGPAGYGRYHLLLEHVGQKVKGSSGYTVSHDLSTWAQILRTKSDSAEILLGFCSDSALIVLGHSGNDITISIPKLLEIRDEYSEKSGHGRENVPTNSPQIQIQRQNTEIELLPEYSGSPQKAPKVKKETKPKSDHQRFISTWDEKYKIRFPGEKYVFEGGKDFKSVATILKRLGIEKAESLIDAFLNTDDQWIISNGSFTISMFLSQINKLIQKSAGAPSRQKQIDDELSRV